MSFHEANIRLWLPEKMEVRKMWLKIGEVLERFNMPLWRYQYLVGEDNEDIELEGNAVSWEAIFDWCDVHSNGLSFHAAVTYSDLETGEELGWADIFLENSRRGGLYAGPHEIEPLEIGWLFEMSFPYNAIYLGLEFFERGIVTLSKTLFLEFEGIYGVAGMDWDDPDPKKQYAAVEFARLMLERVLQNILVEGDIWFYLLNKERYEASKPYLPSLPIERVEELPNGGALVLVNYPEFKDDD